MDPDADVTPELDVFIDAYGKDDNVWWRLASGHHQNLFDAMWERADAQQESIDALVEVMLRLENLTCGKPTPPWPKEDVVVWARAWLERYLEAMMVIPPPPQVWS